VLATSSKPFRFASDDVLVEIGPGEGALTYRLLDKVRRLEVIEIDRDLAARLDKVKVHQATRSNSTIRSFREACA